MIEERRFDLLISIAVVLLVVGMLWSMIGLHRTTLLFEGWAAVNLIESDTPAVPAPSRWATRPLHWAIYELAYHFDTPSQLGFNIGLVMLNVLRGLLTLVVMRRLLAGARFIPLATAILFLVYPIGDGYFNFRALPIQVALNLGLLAVWCLLIYWQQPRRWLWLIILPAQVLSLLTYELLYAVFAFVPVLLWWLERRISLNSRFLIVSAGWYSLYSLVAGRLLYLLAQGSGGYVSGRVEDRLSDRSIPELLVHITCGLYKDHLRAWWVATKFLNESREVVVIAVVTAVVVTAAGWYLLREEEERLSWGSLITLVGGGIVFMFIAYIHNLPIAERASGFRVFFSATLGAAFIIAILLYAIRQYVPYGLGIAVTGIGLLTFVGMVDTLLQNHYYAELSMERQRVLAQIVTTVPRPDSDVTMLVIDEGLLFQGTEQPYARSSYLDEALELIYETPVAIRLCALVPRNETCTFEADRIVYDTRFGNRQFVYQYDNVIIFRTTDDEDIELLEALPERYIGADVPYNPRALIDADAPYPANARTFFTCFPLAPCDNLPTLDFRQKHPEYR